MFPLNLFDSVITDYTRRVRQVNCFGWMRENLSRAGGRFGRHNRNQHRHTN